MFFSWTEEEDVISDKGYDNLKFVAIRSNNYVTIITVITSDSYLTIM